MYAYHNDPKLKADFLKVLRWHQEQDRIIQKTYWDNADTIKGAVNGFAFTSAGRGCAVGCSIESLRIITGRERIEHDDHALYEKLIGVPRVLARLEDGIFEGLPVEDARQWPVRFADAIPVSADLSLVWPRFAVWMLGDPQDGVIRFAKTDEQRAAIQTIIDMHRRLIAGDPPTQSEWHAADADAYAAAYADAAYAADADAYAAAYADAADAAYAAYAYAYAYAADAYADAAYADADAYADAYAADAYADAAYADADAAYAAAAAAHHQARQRQAAKLLELLRDT